MPGRLLSALLWLLLATLPAGIATAQAVDPATAAIQSLDKAAVEYRAIDTAFDGRVDADERRALIDRANAVGVTAGDTVTALTGQMALLDARIAQLGPVSPGGAEPPDIAAQRRQLAAQHAQLDGAIKRGKLLGVESSQLAAEIRDSEATALSERINARTASPLTPRFWTMFAEQLPRDVHRFEAFVAREAGAIAGGVRRGAAWQALLGLALAIVLLVPVRIALDRVGRTLMIERAPATRLRRSGLALWIAVSGTVLPGLAAVAFAAGMRSAGMIAPGWSRLADILVRVSLVSGSLAALGQALLQPRQPSWRLPAIDDEAAAAFQRWALVGVGVVVFTALSSSLMSEAGSNGPLTIATDGVCVLIDLALVIGVLRTIARYRTRAEAQAEAQAEAGDQRAASAGGAGLGLVALVGWVASTIAVLSLLGGYVSFALLVSRLMIWWPLVGASLYLLMVATDDLATGLVSRESGIGRSLVHGFGVRGSLVDQVGVFLSALLRLLLVAVALSVAAGPFGSNVTSLLDIAARAARGLTIGEITVSPGAILRALAVLAVGLFVVRLVQHWLTDRYLPATELDAGARNSIAMVARYAGLILAALWALASLGIGIERIALLLSALSVGIGFGLQAITQNFVSGLILLAERPVKIGDWVRIGTDEGDVKRISVRATEIQIADKSTLIVPNSELITKTVLNKTLADPIGRIQLQFSLVLGADVGRARDMLMDIYRDMPAVLDEPAPVVFVDSVADGRVALNSFAYVRSPRDVYPTRSAILFRLLDDLPAAGIELGTAPTQMQIVSDAQGAPPAPQDASAAS